MKNLLFTFALVLLSLGALAQNGQSIDTIYSSGKAIPCNIIEVNEQSVRYTHPGETHANNMYISVISKIVFRSGRVQEFALATSFKKLTSPDDWDNIVISQMESEILGLYKLGETNAKAKGTTSLSSQEAVKQRAMRKFKAKAAMMGGNAILVFNMRQAGNSYNAWTGGSSSAETSLTGVVYTNSLPALEDLKSVIGDNKSLRATVSYKLANSDSDYSKRNSTDVLKIYAVGSDNGILYIEGEIQKGKVYKYKVSFVNSKDFYIYYQDKNVIYAYKIEK